MTAPDAAKPHGPTDALVPPAADTISLTMRLLMQTLLAALALAWTTPIATAEVRIIVSRNADVTVVYLRAPLADVEGTVLDRLAPRDGFETTMEEARDVALAAIADLANGMILTVDASPLPLTAQSGVYHRVADALSFETPFDASISSVICATPEARLPDADALSIYAAWVAPVPLSAGSIALDWTGPDAMPVTASVLVFERGRLRTESSAMIGPGATLDLSLPPRRRTAGLPLALAALGTVLLLFAGAVWQMRRRQKQAVLVRRP